jgi:putative inorganic carbon (hco3(-)) transporter
MFAVRYWQPPVVIMAIFMTFVVARYMQWGARKEILATVRIEFIMGILLSISCAFLLQSSPIKLTKLVVAKQVVIGITLLFVAMIIQIPFAADAVLAQQIFVDRVIKFAMLTFFMIVLIRSPKEMRLFIIAFLFACFYVTQEAARGAFNGGLIWQNQGIMRLHGAVPIYRHPNSLAGVSMGVIPFVVFLLPAIKRWWVRLILIAPLGTAMICLLYSGSRTGYVAFFSFILYWFLKVRRKGRWILIAVGLGLAVYPVVPKQYIERFESIGGQEAEGESKEMRFEILDDAMAILMANPIGVGVASFPAVREEMFGRKQDTHNLYLEVATNLGFQGLGIFLFLVGAILRGFSDAEKKAGQLLYKARKFSRNRKLGASERRKLKSQIDDLVFLSSVARAGAGFVWIRLALGLFGMDLYEVYWWFAAGLVISLQVILLKWRHVPSRWAEFSGSKA